MVHWLGNMENDRKATLENKCHNIRMGIKGKRKLEMT